MGKGFIIKAEGNDIWFLSGLGTKCLRTVSI